MATATRPSARAFAFQAVAVTIAGLCECLAAVAAGKWSLTEMCAHMVDGVAQLEECDRALGALEDLARSTRLLLRLVALA